MAADAEEDREPEGGATDGLVKLVQTAGGALIVTFALIFTFVVGLTAVALAEPADRVSIASAAFAAIGTIAGTYFGIRMGADGKERAEKERRESQRLVEHVAAKVGEGPVKEAREEIRRGAAA